MLTDEQRIKIYGSAERVAEVDRQIEADVAAMPALSQRQRDALRILLGTRTMPPRPAPAVAPVSPMRLPKPRRGSAQTTAAAPATGTAA